MLLDKIKNSFSGWLTIQNTNENRPTLISSLINRKSIKNIGQAYKCIDVHTLENGDNIIVGSIKITLKSTKDTNDNRKAMMDALSTLEKLVALMGDEKKYEQLMDIISKTDFSEKITIPEKKNTQQAQPTEPKVEIKTVY